MTKKAMWAALAFVVLSVPTARGDFTATGPLLGLNEVPPNASTAFGFALLTYEPGLNDILYSIMYNNLTGNATGLTVNSGAPGATGPAIFDLTAQLPANSTSGSLTGVLHPADLIPYPGGGINTFADAAAALNAGTTYVNLTSTEFTGGEIRANLTVPEPSGIALFGLGAAGSLVAVRTRRRRGTD